MPSTPHRGRRPPPAVHRRLSPSVRSTGTHASHPISSPTLFWSTAHSIGTSPTAAAYSTMSFAAAAVEPFSFPFISNAHYSFAPPLFRLYQASSHRQLHWLWRQCSGHCRPPIAVADVSSPSGRLLAQPLLLILEIE
uniref:Uncharacterized protein n=1 Tax=Opuntia streptacantha TaxID=393608 RepID=A0A7C9CH86_OPUST